MSLASSCTGCSVPLSADYEFRNVTVETYVAEQTIPGTSNVWMSVQKTAKAVSRQRAYADGITAHGTQADAEAVRSLVSTESIVMMTATEARSLAAALLRSADATDAATPQAPTYRAELAATAAALNRAPRNNWTDTPENRAPQFVNTPSPVKQFGDGKHLCVYCHQTVATQPLDAAHGNSLWTHAASGDVLCYPAKGRQSSHAYPARTLADIAP
jgi:hypothetical protein